jgi:hypothetical protein
VYINCVHCVWSFTPLSPYRHSIANTQAQVRLAWRLTIQMTWRNMLRCSG